MNKVSGLATCSFTTSLFQHRNLSFGKISEWYQRFWRPPAPSPPYTHICQIGDPVLRQKATSVDPKEIKSVYIQKVISRMKKAMKTYDAVGLAAPQIGVPLRIITIEFSASRKKEFDEKTYKGRQMQTIAFKVLINPELRVNSADKVKFPESCESIKGFSADVPRFTAVTVKALNEKGESIEWHATGWPARIVQHEVDHLDGKFYTDHMDRNSFTCAYWHSVNVRGGRFSLTFAPFKKF